jgi:SAM-dependent methyltransferase
LVDNVGLTDRNSTVTATGNLSLEAQARYAFVESLLRRDFQPPARVLELGAAPGDQIAKLAREGFRATAVDIDVDSDMWGAGEVGRMRRLFEAEGVEYVPWNLEETPYPLPDNRFDAVVMTEVFEHLRDYPIRSLIEVRRLLRARGRLYFTTPNQAYLMNRLRLLRGHNVATPLGDWIDGQVFARHAREYTFPEVAELMRRADLVTVERHSRHFHIASGKAGVTARFSKRWLSAIAAARPTLGPQIIVVAEKAS